MAQLTSKHLPPLLFRSHSAENGKSKNLEHFHNSSPGQDKCRGDRLENIKRRRIWMRKRREKMVMF
jgi:hypothetical protein